MKSTLLLVLILISSVYCKEYEGVFIHHSKHDSTEKESHVDKDLVSLLKHNYGVLEKNSSDKADKLIEKMGKGNLMAPV
jgi:hypothetical protein